MVTSLTVPVEVTGIPETGTQPVMRALTILHQKKPRTWEGKGREREGGKARLERTRGIEHLPPPGEKNWGGGKRKEERKKERHPYHHNRSPQDQKYHGVRIHGPRGETDSRSVTFLQAAPPQPLSPQEKREKGGPAFRAEVRDGRIEALQPELQFWQGGNLIAPPSSCKA